MAHRTARLTEFGRLLLVQRVTELGWPPAQAAESLGVSRTARSSRAASSSAALVVRSVAPAAPSQTVTLSGSVVLTRISSESPGTVPRLTIPGP